MNLQGQFFLRVEKFDYKRETRHVCDFPKNFFAKIAPKIMQRPSCHWASPHNTLSFGPVDEFPRFANAFPPRQIFSEKLRQFLTTPNSLLKERRKKQRRIGAKHRGLTLETDIEPVRESIVEHDCALTFLL